LGVAPATIDRLFSLLPARAQPQPPPLSSPAAPTPTTAGASPPLQPLGAPPPLASMPPATKAPLSSYAATVKGAGETEAGKLSACC
jgi:hypothetical protein